MLLGDLQACGYSFASNLQQDMSGVYLYLDFVQVSHLRATGINMLGYRSHVLQRCHPVCGLEGHYHLTLSTDGRKKGLVLCGLVI